MKKESHIRISYSFLRRTDLTPLDKLLYARLLNYCHQTGEGWPHQDTLAADLGTDTRAIQRSQRRLQAAGLLEVIPTSRGKGNRYRALPTDQAAIKVEVPICRPTDTILSSDARQKSTQPGTILSSDRTTNCRPTGTILSSDHTTNCRTEGQESAANKGVAKVESENRPAEVVNEVIDTEVVDRANRPEVVELSSAKQESIDPNSNDSQSFLDWVAKQPTPTTIQ